MTTIYLIGHSNRSASDFVHELTARGVRLLIDVRSSPRSRFKQFGRDALEAALATHGIAYSWRGEVLGGRTTIAVDDPTFAAALVSVISDASCNPIALMCAEGDPADCHRSGKIGAALIALHGQPSTNILRDGTDEGIEATLARTSPDLIPSELQTRLALGPQAELDLAPRQYARGADDGRK